MKVYMVGGAVRDLLQGKTARDIDYCVVGSSVKEMLTLGFSQVGADFPVFLHPTTHAEYALARVERKTGTGYNGFTTETQAVTLEQDLSRRDLTINAMAMDEGRTLIDPYNGRKDLEAKLLRHVSPAFAEDPLRVLRVARFMARFGPTWNIAEETMELMHEMVDAGALDELSRERVWVEIEKGLGEAHPELMLRVLRDLKVLGRPAFSEYAGALTCDILALRRAVEENASVTVRFALAFPKQWKTEELKASRIPKQVREVSHCLMLGLSKGLGEFSKLSPSEKVSVLTAIDALRQNERMLFILAALRLTHPAQAEAVGEALVAIALLDTAPLIAGLTGGEAIRKKIELARIEAVAAICGPRYIPVGVYTFGCCHYGGTVPFKTVEVKADLMKDARAAAYRLLQPSTTQHICYVATKPNPVHMMTLVAAGLLQP